MHKSCASRQTDFKVYTKVFFKKLIFKIKDRIINANRKTTTNAK